MSEGEQKAVPRRPRRCRRAAIAAAGVAIAVAVAAALVAVWPGDDGDAGEDVLAPAEGHRLVVYLLARWASPLGGPSGRIVTYDLDAARELAAFEVAGAMELPPMADLAGSQVVVATSEGVARYALDGSGRFELYRATGAAVQDVAVSPDGRTVAVAESGLCAEDGSCAESAVVFVDVASGRELQRVGQRSPAFDSFAGYFYRVNWRDDGRGVIVGGGTNSERPGGWATVMVDGTARVHFVGFPVFDSAARIAVVGPQSPESCDFVSTLRLAVVDLDSGAELAVLEGGQRAFTPWAISPDGTELLYQERDYVPDSSCIWTGARPRWFLLDVASGGSIRVAGPDPVLRRWYAGRLVELECGEGRVAIPPRGIFGWPLYCPSGEDPPVLRFWVNGQPVGVYTNGEIIGFIDP